MEPTICYSLDTYNSALGNSHIMPDVGSSSIHPPSSVSGRSYRVECWVLSNRRSPRTKFPSLPTNKLTHSIQLKASCCRYGLDNLKCVFVVRSLASTIKKQVGGSLVYAGCEAIVATMAMAIVITCCQKPTKTLGSL